MDIALSIEKLLPAAKYGGSVTANTEAAFNSIRWEDPRPKPKWTDLEMAALTILPPKTPEELKTERDAEIDELNIGEDFKLVLKKYLK